MERRNKKAASQANTFVLCPIQQIVPILKEAMTLTGAFYKGRPVKDGKEVVDYLLVELSVMFDKANNECTRHRVDQEAIA